MGDETQNNLVCSNQNVALEFRTEGFAVTVQWIIFAILASVLVTLEIVRQRNRERRIRHIAQVYGLACVGSVLPRNFPFSKMSVRSASRIRNVVVGDLGTIRFVIFDCQFGGGKHRWSQSVVAAQGSLDSFGYQRYDSTLTVETVEDWTIVFRKKQLLLPEEIETLLPAK